jgi:hypothetical protein
MRLRYVRGKYQGKHTVHLTVTPYIGNKNAYIVSSRLKRIAEELWLNGKKGMAGNSVYTSHGIGVLFQDKDVKENEHRAWMTGYHYRKRFPSIGKEFPNKK